MKTSLTKLRAFIRGAMIGLALNLSLLPMAQAQQASPPRLEEPAVIVPIDPPIVIPIDPQPVDPFDAAEALQRDIYDRLFGGGFELYAFAYELSDHVASTGIYSGLNDHGTPFDLNVVVAQELPLDAVEMDAEQAGRVAEENLRITSVVASVTGPAGAAACLGLVVSRAPAEGASHRLVIMSELPLSSGLFDGYPATLAGTQPSPDPGSPWEIDPPDGSPDPRDACDRCHINASQQAADAFREYERIEMAAREARDAAIVQRRMRR